MWTMGELPIIDDFSNLFNGTRKAFPLTVGGEAFAIQAASGSNIVVREYYHSYYKRCFTSSLPG